jgi:crotonobetainyl-CoA:carnitine CoA-transferase CaiB-like acyl-CoA transferase
MGSGSPFTAPTDVYQTQDGHIVLAVVNEKHWSIFCQVLRLEHLHSDPRFGSNESRVAQAGILRSEVNAVLATKSTSEWLVEFDRAGIPAGQVMTYADVVADEQIQFNEMIIESEHPVAGNFKMQGIPFWFAGEKNRNHLPPPVRGADTEEVLLEMGCPPDVIAELVVP